MNAIKYLKRKGVKGAIETIYKYKIDVFKNAYLLF